MKYIDTATSLLQLAPTLPQTSVSAGFSATVSKATAHINRAEAIVDSHISGRYNISAIDISSITAVPPILKNLTEDISLYYLLRSFYTQDNQNISEWVESYKEAMESLEKIRSGDMDVIDANNVALSASTTVGSVESTTEDFTPTFNENRALNWDIDEDKPEFDP